MVFADPRAILPEPPDELKRHSSRLAEQIRLRIADEGPIPFSTYMEMALYEPGLGYYSAGLRKFGSGGDFTTAPELGGLFARCLAAQATEIVSGLDAWEVLEIGAGSGRLAAGFLTALPAGAVPRRYRILERSADLRRIQQERLGRLSQVDCEFEWLDRPPDSDWEGLLLANEVIDALAVERFELAESGVWRLGVDHGADGFAWAILPASAQLRQSITAALGPVAETLPAGFRSEILPQLPAWLEGLTRHMRRGVALFCDYGYTRREYYRSDRSDGTLVCHYRHRAHDDPFAWPGLQDISAFVDFTALAEAGHECGLDCAGYATQAMFLFGCGLEEILADQAELPTRERLAVSEEIRMLTLPGEMGEKFQCMALARNVPGELRGFSWQDLRYRL